MPSFKVPCPSCEAPVVIKDPKLIGTKVECPKCKYRFKVEKPAEAEAPAAAADADAKPETKEPEKKPAEKKKKKPKTPMSKKTKAMLIGGVAVVGLIILAVIIFAGDDDKKPPVKGNPSGNPSFVNNNSNNPNPDNPEQPAPDGKNPAPPKPPEEKGGPPPIPSSKKNATNLLPGDSVAVYRIHGEQLRNSAPYETVVGEQIFGMFQNSLGFGLEEVETYIHCFVGETRQPFGVIKLRLPARPEDLNGNLLKTQTLQFQPKVVQGYNLYPVRSNPFLSAVSHTLSRISIFGGFLEQVPPAETKPQTMGICVYDNQHILVGDFKTVETFLKSLDIGGNAPFQTVMMVDPVAPPAPPAPKDGMPPQDGMPPKPQPQPQPKAAPGDNRPLTSIDTYRTIKPPLKRLLDELEAGGNPPMLTFVDELNFGTEILKLVKKDHWRVTAAIRALFQSARYLSGSATTFTQRQLVANLRFTLNSSDEARTLAKNPMAWRLDDAARTLAFYLEERVDFRDNSLGNPVKPIPNPNPGTPEEPGTMPPGEGIPKDLQAPVQPVQPEPPPTPPVPVPGQDPTMDPKIPPAKSHIDLGMVDKQLIVSVDLTWSEAVYRTKIAPQLVSLANQIRGKMAVFAHDYYWQPLASAGQKVVETSKQFPTGTAFRGGNQSRYGLPYPPVQRVSLFVDLLPYLGRNSLRDDIDKSRAWYDEKNMPEPGHDKAGAWVPELLVPYYPQSAWRATSPLAPNHNLGATNYVAIAGVGLDIPRVNPDSPELKKYIGITGYDWGSKVEEVTDGLSNTIYMMQTPPGLQQPWIAGGGATVRGLDEANPMAGFTYSHPDGKGGTKQGTYALMGDGSARWIPANINPKVLKAMATRGAGDGADLGDINVNAPKVEPVKPEAPKAEAPAPKPEPKKEEKKPEDKKEAKNPEEKKPEGKKPEDKKPEDKKSEEKKPEPKATDPKKSEEK